MATYDYFTALLDQKNGIHTPTGYVRLHASSVIPALKGVLTNADLNLALKMTPIKHNLTQRSQNLASKISHE
ncbi:MAG: hypothetical protein ABL927_13355 [Bdellovibrionales bacterium]